MTLVAALAMFALAASPDASAPPSPAASSSSPSTSSPSSRTSHFHRGLAPTAASPRVVSLSPAVTETLFSLGVGGRLVGATRFCDRPAAAIALPKVGGYVDASLEAILTLRPDLVIAQPSFGQRQLLDRLHERGVPVFVVFADSVDENVDLLRGLGRLFDRPAEADRLVQAQTRAFAPSPGQGSARVVVVVGTDPLVVAGRKSFADDAVRAAGASSAIRDDDPPWPAWSLEVVANRRVDVVVAAEGPAAVPRLERLLQPLGARRPRVVAATGAILMRPGPALADDVMTLRALLRPTAGATP